MRSIPLPEERKFSRLFGLAPCGVYHAACITAGAVRSYRTFSPLLLRPRGPKQRYRLCGTGRLCALTRKSRALPGTLPIGVRTFLPRFQQEPEPAAIVQPACCCQYTGTPAPHVRPLEPAVCAYHRPCMQTLGLIAGNGQFPFLLLDAARARNLRVVVAAIQQETDDAMNTRAQLDRHITVHWLSLGDLSRLIETFQREGVTEAVMAGQVRHKQIFSSIRPDWRLAKLLLNLRTRSTDMLLGAVARVLEDEGIRLISSTAYLEPLLARPGTLTAREPTPQEREDIAYGLRIAKHLAAVDLGQTVVIAASACVAVEAMEGTDSTILRAGQLLNGTAAGREAQTLRSTLTVVKVAKPNQDLRFDVPVIGVPTIDTMQKAGATCLAVEAARTLIFHPEATIAAANAAGIAITGELATP